MCAGDLPGYLRTRGTACDISLVNSEAGRSRNAGEALVPQRDYAMSLFLRQVREGFGLRETMANQFAHGLMRRGESHAAPDKLIGHVRRREKTKMGGGFHFFRMEAKGLQHASGYLE